jgi:endonuclease V-like protein UPF0215 family
MRNVNRPSSYKKLTYAQKVSLINRKLRIGDITLIAESTGYSQGYVSLVASGKYENQRIINALYDRTRGRMPNPDRIASLINHSEGRS